MKMIVPAYVLNPKDKGKTFISIEEIEPGSALAEAVVRMEREHASYDRLRAIAKYLQVRIK
jgi:hypothetical protein